MTNTIEITLLIGVVSALIGAATFAIGRLTSAKTKGYQEGILVQKLDSMSEKIAVIASNQTKIDGQLMDMIINTEKAKTAADKANEKLDIHIENHNSALAQKIHSRVGKK